MRKIGPKENLLPDQEDNVNKMFYRDYQTDYFNIKISLLTDLLLNTKENVERLSNKSFKLGKIDFKTLDCSDTEEVTNFVKSEIVSEYYHCLETLMRLFISHAMMPLCPLMELTSMNMQEYHKHLNWIAEGDFNNLNDYYNGDKTISLILLGNTDYKLGGITDDNFSNLKNWIIYCAQELQKMSEYNSHKHGLSMFVGKGKIKVTNPEDGEILLEKAGDSVHILEKTDTGTRYEFSIKNIFVEYDYKVTLILFYNEMINNIIEIGKWHYVTKEKKKTISGLHFMMLDYFEFRDMFYEKGNIGALLTSYSTKLAYESDLEEVNYK